MSENNLYEDYIKKCNESNYKIHYTYTDGTDDFDRYDEMETVDTYLKTSEDVMNQLLKLVERGGLEDYCIVDLNRGLKYREVSSFIADYVPYSRQKFYWRAFLNRGVDTEGCKAHLYDEVPNDKGSDRPIELPQDSETLTPIDPDSPYKLFIEPSTPTEVFKDTATMLHFLLQEENATDCDKLLIKAFSNMVDNIIGMREKSQKEDEDYQLYLKLKERFEGGK